MDTFDPKHIYSDAAKLARLKDKKLFLFDIDGTIDVGDTLYEGSADLLRYIQAIGGRAYYITNNSTKSGLDYVKKFHDAFHLDSTETLVVGDRLYTDIACGINGGVDTCVLFTGEAQKKDILTPEGEPNTQYLPDYAFENVQELLNACQGEINFK